MTVHEKFILISLDNLVEANNTLSVVSSTDIRMPGTSIPGVIKAGTYLTANDNREFWFTRDRNLDEIITIELKDHEYDRIVLQSDQNKDWTKKINQTTQ